jgi:hypothetical protein
VQTLEEAEIALGWDIREFAENPSGLSFSRVEVNLEGQFVSTHYEAEGGRLVLSQGFGDYSFDGDWESVPVDAVEPVMIGNASGEYVQGGFVAIDPEDSEATWNPNVAMQRLRWKEGDSWFEIMKQGDAYPIEYLDKAGLIALAENLVSSSTDGKPEANQDEQFGEVYFIVNFDDDFELVRLPGDCVIGLVECPQPDVITTPFNPKHLVRALEWSPDGKKALAIVTSRSDEGFVPPSRLYLFDAEKETWMKIHESSEQTFFGGVNSHWSADGKWVVFAASEGGMEAPHMLYLIHSDGSDLEMLFNASIVSFGWADDKLILQTSDSLDNLDDLWNSTNEVWDMDIYSIDIEGKNAEKLFQRSSPLALLSLSPNASRLVFADQHNQQYPTTHKEIQLFDLSGNQIRTLGSYTNQYFGIYPVWAHAGNLIAFHNYGKMYVSSLDSEPMEIYQVDAPQIGHPSIYQYVFSPNDQYLLMSVYDGLTKFVAVSTNGKVSNVVAWPDLDNAKSRVDLPSWRPSTD